MVARLSKLGFINTSRTNHPVRRRIRSRGVPTALADHLVFCTGSRDEAEMLGGKLLGAHRLTVLSDDEPFEASLHAVRLGDVTFGHLDYHHPTRLEFSATGNHFLVLMPTSGEVECRYNGADVAVTTYQAVVVNPATKLYLSLGLDTPVLVVRIEVQALEHQLSRMLGRAVEKPVVFEPQMDLTSDPAVRWHGALQLLSSEVMTPRSLIQQGIGAEPIEELVISSLLWVQRSSAHWDLTHVSTSSGRAATREAIAYIERHLADPITVKDIARATNLSTRAIQQAFHDDLATTPMHYVRDRRLERARDQLAGALPSDGITVTEVAERWGFGHLGNFSGAYRRRFGESPSQTLRR